MIAPVFTSIFYEEYKTLLSLVIPMLVVLALGIVSSLFKPKNKKLDVKDGFVIVGLSWIILSAFGCLPFVISGLIPNYIDAFFETVSGFTTTGSSVLTLSDFNKLWNPESQAVGMRGIFFWRSFTNWIGGMGVLVFVLAIMPQQDMKSSRLVHIMRAEMPGPRVDKIVATVRKNAMIMYGIYIVMTLAQAILLMFGGMDLYEALTTSFSTAGTGGFAIWSDSMATFGGTATAPVYCTWVIAIFMLLFSINFNLYFLIITGKILSALLSEELRWFVGIVAVAIGLITLNLCVNGVCNSFFETLTTSVFQVATIISTTGFATTDYNIWPEFPKILLLILMFVGACAGSTGGGIKISRLIIALKGTLAEIGRMIRPRRVKTVRFEGKPVEKDTVMGAFAFVIMYIFIFFASWIGVAIFEGLLGQGINVETSFSAVAACINNIGPGLGDVGPSSNFAALSYPTKIILSLDMLLGRLEIFPILLLFFPSVWREK